MDICGKTFVHHNLVIHIRQFVITQLWIKHVSKMDPKNVKIIKKNDHKWSFFYIIFTFLFGYNAVV